VLGLLPDAQPHPPDPDTWNGGGTWSRRWRDSSVSKPVSSVVMDERHLMAAARCVSLDPVRARLAARAMVERQAHPAGVDDELAQVGPILDCEPAFAAMLEQGCDDGFAALRRSEGSVGTAEFASGLARLLRSRLALGGR
jgi:putative transposase